MPVIGQRSDHGSHRRVARHGPKWACPSSPWSLVETGERVEAVVQDGSAAIPGSGNRAPYEVGDEVVLTRFTGPAADDSFAVIAEPWRLPLLGLVAAAFAAVVIVVGGLRGARSLVALALTLAVVVKLVVPLLLRGVDPILLAVGGGAARIGRHPPADGGARPRDALRPPRHLRRARPDCPARRGLHGRRRIHRAAGQRGDRLPHSAHRRPHRPAGNPAGGYRVRRARRARRRDRHPGCDRRAAAPGAAGSRAGRRHRPCHARRAERTSRRPSTRSCWPISAPACRCSCSSR